MLVPIDTGRRGDPSPLHPKTGPFSGAGIRPVTLDSNRAVTEHHHHPTPRGVGGSKVAAGSSLLTCQDRVFYPRKVNK
jgi:hypothetical protein